jgi:hypothetical protein
VNRGREAATRRRTWSGIDLAASVRERLPLRNLDDPATTDVEEVAGAFARAAWSSFGETVVDLAVVVATTVIAPHDDGVGTPALHAPVLAHG